MDSSSLTAILDKHRPDPAPYEDLYRYLHANPELSTQEKETAQFISEHLSKLSSDLDIRKDIGGHGLVAILKNGPGKTVLLRADIDGLPVAEKTGLPYASKKTMEDVDGIVKSVMHGELLCSNTLTLHKTSCYLADLDSYSLRPRHTYHLYARCSRAPSLRPLYLVRNLHLSVPTCRGTCRWCPGHGRRWTLR